MTKNEIYEAYTRRLNSIRYRLNNMAKYITYEERLAYRVKEDMLKEILYDLAHMEEEGR